MSCDTWFRLFRFRSPLLTESQLFSFPPGTKMFQFPGYAAVTYEFSYGFSLKSERVAPFGNPRIKAWLTAPRGLSQPPTSFIACFSQGIHTMRYVTFFFSLVRKCSIQRIKTLTDNRLTVKNVCSFDALFFSSLYLLDLYPALWIKVRGYTYII